MHAFTAVRVLESIPLGPDVATSTLLSRGVSCSTIFLTMASISGRPDSITLRREPRLDEVGLALPNSTFSCSSSSGDGMGKGIEISSFVILLVVTWILRLTFGEL
jgi:hypothetical protein